MNAVGETELDRYLRDLMAMVARATPVRSSSVAPVTGGTR